MDVNSPKYAAPSSTVARAMRKLKEQMDSEGKAWTPSQVKLAELANKKRFASHNSDRQAGIGSEKEPESPEVLKMREAIAAQKAPVALREKTDQVFAKYGIASPAA